jgi:chromate reductase
VSGDVIFTVYKGLGTLPHFNGSPEPAQEVMEFRQALNAADGVLICSPEYAFGVPGSLKNALDWTVTSGDLVNKPVALITAATGGDKAHTSMLLTLSALSAQVAEACTLHISFVRSKLDEKGVVKNDQTLQAIQGVMDALTEAIDDNNE